MFDDEFGQVLKRAVSPVSTACKVAATPVLTELQDDPTAPQGKKMGFPGAYCIVIFENDEERAMFKLAVPNDEDFEKRVHEVLREVG